MQSFYLKYKPHYRTNLKLAIPVVVSQLGHTLVQVSDSVIVGHFAGTIPLAAVSLVNSIFTIILVIGIGISYGLTPLISQANGREGYDECGRLLSNSLLINVVISLFLFALIYFGLLLVIDRLDQAPEVVAQAKPFLSLLGISIIPLMVFSTFKQFAEGLGFTKQAMMISIWGNILNIILGIIFVKGLFGIKPMGVRGVGYSTLIDRSVMAITMAVYVFRSKYFKAYLKHFSLTYFNRERLIAILKIGAPVAMQYTFEVSAFGGAAIMMGMIGPNQQAAHQVAISLAAMTYMMASGISSAAAIQTGHSYGKKDIYYLRYSAISSYHIVLAFMFFTALIFILFNQYLPWLYTSDHTVIGIASGLLIIAGFFQIFDGAQVVGLGILRGMSDVNIPTLITFLAYWILGLPVAYLLGVRLNFGAEGIWYGLTLGLLASAAMLFWRFQYVTKKFLAS
ncbi:MATE family efflux transporter [Pedobacter sp. HMF7647]|uniref:Multidrug-efflux transporter n=1 Tax=Hufsiella arboris TaxID=2695275 RepID=A0A7K1Y7V7_9SPHI|nr:MATE family efflux transporter [Hufsiella arboris]MXV50674.1 MATE family efflux transporter [Hufsiella arboris]